MRSLDPRNVQESRGIADQRAARKGELRHRLIATVADRARAIGDALAALQYLRDLRVRLPLLHFLEGRGVRVAIVEPGHETERDLPIRLMIEEAAAVGVRVARPALRVEHPPRRLAGGVDAQQFLAPQAIALRLAITTGRAR